MKDYRSTRSVLYEQPERRGFTSINILPFLIGRKWDEHALAFVHAVRPSSIRVTNGEETSDAWAWRVTVVVDSQDFIQHISQEVEVGLTPDWRYGHDADLWKRGGAR